jgi:DNA-directed RNA polymerase specialized sigma24 family protein
LELPQLKRPPRLPAPGTPAVTQTERYTAMGRALLNRQAATAKVFLEKRYSLREFALAMEVTPGTVRKWIRRGLVKGYRVGSRGWQFIPGSEIERLQSLMEGE